MLATRSNKKLVILKQQILEENGQAAYVVKDVTKKKDLRQLVDIAVRIYSATIDKFFCCLSWIPKYAFYRE